MAALRALLGTAAGFAAAWPQPALAQALDDAVGTGVVTLGVWDWVNLVVRLFVVIGIIWFAFWVMRWYNRRIQTGYGASRALQVLETRALGPNRSLQLVRVGRRAVLVGVTPERINQLLAIDDPEEVDRLAEAAIADRTAAPGLERLAGALSRIALPRRPPREAPAFRASSPDAAAPSEARLAPGAPGAARAPSAQQLQASAAYRSARIAELQRAIEDARRGTILEDAR